MTRCEPRPSRFGLEREGGRRAAAARREQLGSREVVRRRRVDRELPVVDGEADGAHAVTGDRLDEDERTRAAGEGGAVERADVLATAGVGRHLQHGRRWRRRAISIVTMAGAGSAWPSLATKRSSSIPRSRPRSCTSALAVSRRRAPWAGWVGDPERQGVAVGVDAVSAIATDDPEHHRQACNGDGDWDVVDGQDVDRHGRLRRLRLAVGDDERERIGAVVVRRRVVHDVGRGSREGAVGRRRPDAERAGAPGRPRSVAPSVTASVPSSSTASVVGVATGATLPSDATRVEAATALQFPAWSTIRTDDLRASRPGTDAGISPATPAVVTAIAVPAPGTRIGADPPLAGRPRPTGRRPTSR